MTLEVGTDGLVVVEGGCPECRAEVALFRGEELEPRVAGKEISADGAIDAAARILSEARSPFVYGLSRSSSSTARRAAAVAAAIGAAIDVEGSEAIQADLTALSTFGLPSATFGEIRDRADLFLLWRCDPRQSHPGLFAGSSMSGPPGARARAVILVPPTNAPGASADLILPADAGAELEAALALRAVTGGAAVRGARPGGVPADRLGQAAGMLRRARYSAVFWDPAATASGLGVAIASTLTLLARDLNAAARSVARPLGAGGNVAGAIAALAAATGYPRAVGFAGGAPRFAPGEFDAARMIGAGVADVLLLAGARSLERTPGDPEGRRQGAARKGAGNKDDAARPAGRGGRRRSRAGSAIVVIGPRLPRGADVPDVWIPTATPGLSARGCVARADGMTVVLKALVPTRLPTEDDVLDRLLARLAAPSRSRDS